MIFRRLNLYTSSHWPAYALRHVLPHSYYGWSEGRRSFTVGIYWWRWSIAVSYDRMVA